jgi:hypothetical protein
VDRNEALEAAARHPQLGRFLALVPGVQSDRYADRPAAASGRTGGVNVHGNRSLQNNFLPDGVANNSFSTNVQLTTVIRGRRRTRRRVRS